MICLRQTSKISFFLFVLNYNYLILRLIVFPYLYKEYSYMSYIYIGIIIFVLLIIFLIMPKFIYKNNLIDKYDKSKFKNIYNIIILFKTILMIYLGSYIIYNLDYDMYSIYYFLILVTIVSIFISRLKSNEIIELSTWFVITAILIYMLAFLHLVNIDMTSLKIFDIKLPNVSYYLIILSVFSDNILLLLTDKTNVNFDKKSIILPLITQFIFMMFELYQMLLSAGDILFNDYEFIGFITLSFKTTSNYIGNLDFVYLFIITMSIVINSAFNFSIIRHSYNTKYKILIEINCLFKFIYTYK